MKKLVGRKKKKAEPEPSAPPAAPEVSTKLPDKSPRSAATKPKSAKMPPKPPEKELNQMYNELLVGPLSYSSPRPATLPLYCLSCWLPLQNELGISEAQKKAMLAFPSDRKWTLICQYRTEGGTQKGKTPESYIKMLNSNFTSKNLEDLRVSLAGAPMSWIENFVGKSKGLRVLFKNLQEVIDKPE